MMRVTIFCMCMFTAFALQAQTLQKDLETGKALLQAKKEKEALPYFQKIMASTDEPLKRNMINFVTENWQNGNISFSTALKEYVTLGSQYMTATFSGKEARMNANDHYTAGLIFWSFVSSGLNSYALKAVSQLGSSYQKGNKQALHYLPDAMAWLKKRDGNVTWTDVLQIHGEAATVLNTIKPITKLGWSNYSDLSSFSQLSTSQKDTAKQILQATLELAVQALPDSFYKVVDYYWLRTYNTFGRQDTLLTGLLNRFFLTTELAQVKQARKGMAWHYLYKYFYENLPRNNDVRLGLITKLKALYPREENALLLAISEFLKEAKGNIFGIMLSADAKWLNSFTPATITFADKFFYAAALTEQDFIPFLDKNPDASSTTAAAIASGFRMRLLHLFGILNDNKENLKVTTSTVNIATKSAAEMISKLLERNDMKNIAALKHARADMKILENLSRYMKDMQLPMFLDEVPVVFKNWSVSDKSSYDSRYLKLLIDTIQPVVSEGKKGNNPLDLKDYDKAQKTLNELKVYLN